MQRTPQMLLGSGTLAAIVLAATISVSLGPMSTRTASADPPADQEYVGAKNCASCHFEEYMKWRKTGHAKAFEMLTSKYEEDAKCLKCHTTGYGEPTGFKDMATTPALAGISCESCHGPGSKHVEVSKPFAKVKELTPEQSELVKGSIWLMLPKNICVECHNMQAHKDSQTPPELRK
jgi:hypothetical protein